MFDKKNICRVFKTLNSLIDDITVARKLSDSVHSNFRSFKLCKTNYTAKDKINLFHKLLINYVIFVNGVQSTFPFQYFYVN